MAIKDYTDDDINLKYVDTIQTTPRTLDEIVKGSHSAHASRHNAGGADALTFPVVYADKLNLKIIVNATNPTYQIDIDADGLNMYNSSEEVKHANAVNLTIDITASGANGLDTGSEAASTWYSIWVIGKADGTVAGLLHAGGTGVIGDLTFPSGYTYARRIGWVRNDAGSNFIKGYWHSDGFFEWDAISLIANGVTNSSTSYADLDCSAWVPPEFFHIFLYGTPAYLYTFRKKGATMEIDALYNWQRIGLDSAWTCQWKCGEASRTWNIYAFQIHEE